MFRKEVRDIFKSRNLIRAEDYADELGIELSELVGLIKSNYYYGEERDGAWYVEPEPRKPKTELGRLLWFIVVPGLISMATQVSHLPHSIWGAAEVLLLWFVGGAVLGFMVYLLSKFHQMP